ncbi:MAG: hypothetical protein IJ133_01065 [Clostridia bacterium]|nr:hypothetical protein [Clostridia bacterium]
MKKVVSLLLSLLMVFTVGTASLVSASAADKQVVPNQITNTYTKGSYTASFDKATRALYYENKDGISTGVFYPFMTLNSASKRNKNIMLMYFGEPVIYSLSDVARSGKAKEIVVLTHFQYQSGTVTLEEHFKFTRNDNGWVTKCQYTSSCPRKDWQSPASTYTFSYGSQGGIKALHISGAGMGDYGVTFQTDSDNNLQSAAINDNGKQFAEPVTLDSKGRVTKFGQDTFSYGSNGLVNKINTSFYNGKSRKVSLTYYDSGNYVKSATVTNINNGQAGRATRYDFEYSYL